MFFFFGQYLTASMVLSGAIICHDQCDNHESSNSSSQDSQDHCTFDCGCNFLTFTLESVPTILGTLFEREIIFAVFTLALFEEPVFGVDYPPQLIPG